MYVLCEELVWCLVDCGENMAWFEHLTSMWKEYDFSVKKNVCICGHEGIMAWGWCV